jgi:uncharacterized protein (TIGR02172 family)
MIIGYVSTDEKSVTLKLEGRVDATNATLLSEELEKLRKEHPQGNLTLDVEKLTYISSAGLRSLLKQQKQEQEKLKLINASAAVAEIFEVTGFDSLMDVKKAYEQVSVEGLELIGQGANGKVYRMDPERIIKVYQPDAALEDIERERELAQKAFLKGINTAITYNIAKCGDCFGVIFELLNAKSLSETIVANPQNYDRYAKEYVEVYKSFHTTQVEKGEFPAVKDIYHGYIDGCRDWYTQEELCKLRKLVDSIPDRNTLIHGDYHARNIMVVEGELMMIDMGDVSMGHPMFDFLATAATQANLVDLNPEYAPIHTGMPVEYIKRLWNDLLKLYFADKSAEEVAAIDKQIRNYTKLKVALAPVVGRGAGEEIIRASVQDAKDNLIPIIDDLIGTINW